MFFKTQLRKLEGSLRTHSPSCSECKAHIITEEHHPDGTITFPFGEPCSVCDSYPPDGSIARIIVDLTAEEPGGGIGY